MNSVNRIFLGWVKNAVSLQGRIVQGPFRVTLDWCDDYITATIVSGNNTSVEQSLDVERLPELKWVLPYDEVKPKGVGAEDVAGLLLDEDEPECHVKAIYEAALVYSQAVLAYQHLESIDYPGRHETCAAKTGEYSWLEAAVTDIKLGLKALSERITENWAVLTGNRKEVVKLATDRRLVSLYSKRTFWKEMFTEADKQEMTFARRILTQISKKEENHDKKCL